MVGRTSNWQAELGRWLKPFLDRLDHKARRQMCPLYVSGLIGPSRAIRAARRAISTALSPCSAMRRSASDRTIASKDFDHARI